MITKLFEFLSHSLTRSVSVPKSPFHLINYVRSTTESPLSAIIKINKIGDHLLMELPKVQIELLAGALSRSKSSRVKDMNLRTERRLQTRAPSPLAPLRMNDGRE